MKHSLTLSVHYPAAGGQILLRTEDDWEKNLEPTGGDKTGTRFDFTLETDDPFLYFKPVLVKDGELSWSKGENYLALADGPARLDLYPHFFADTTCSVCNLNFLRSKTAEREHAVRVFYPPGYGENTLARYPVIYMQDGQNLFFPDEAFGGHHWQVEETLSILDSMNLIQKAIVVGVYPQNRMEDYTQPGYEAYGRFVVEELKPWVDGKYRTLDGPKNTGVMGSSLGGVVSFYLGWNWPQVFGLVAAMSSTFGYQDDLTERVATEPKRRLKIYLDSGWPRDNYEVTRNLRNLLIQRGYREGQELLYMAFPNARHTEAAWAMRAHIPFQHFFSQ